MTDLWPIVQDYIYQPTPDRALMITAPWGSGKTFFWKTQLLPKLKEVKIDEQNITPIYVSLYGLRSTDAVDKAIFLAAHPTLAKGTKILTRVLGLIGRKAEGLDESVQSATQLFEGAKPVFCFDDLERAELDANTILGYLNVFVEHDLSPTIIICNEEEIQNLDRYRKLKEKIVGRTVRYMPDHEEIFKAIVANETEGVESARGYLTENATKISKILVDARINNFRVVRQSVRVFSKALEASLEIKGSVESSLLWRIWRFSFAIVGALDLDGKEPSFLAENLHVDAPEVAYALYQMEKSDTKRNQLAEQVEESYFVKFIDRFYAGSPSEYVFFPSLFEYAHQGLWRKSKFLSEVRALTGESRSGEDMAYAKLTNSPYELSDSEFRKHFVIAIEEARNGRLDSPEKYYRLFSYMAILAKENVTPIDCATLLDHFKQGFRQALTSGRIAPGDCPARDIQHFRFGFQKAPREVEAFLKFAEQEMANEADRRIKTCLSELVSNIGTSGKEDLADAMVSGSGPIHEHYPVFRAVDAEDIARRLSEAGNGEIIRLAGAVQHRYRASNIRDFLSEDRSGLKALRKAAANLNSGGSEPLKDLNIRGLVDTLDMAITKLAPLPSPDPVSDVSSGDEPDQAQPCEPAGAEGNPIKKDG